MPSVRTLKSIILMSGVIALPSTASAQASAQTNAPAAETTPAVTGTAADSAKLAGPRIAPMGMRRTADASLVQRARPQSVGKPAAMMVVGGAAVLLGALIGGLVGDVFMLGGAVSFLIGLYEYIR